MRDVLWNNESGGAGVVNGVAWMRSSRRGINMTKASGKPRAVPERMETPEQGISCGDGPSNCSGWLLGSIHDDMRM